METSLQKLLVSFTHFHPIMLARTGLHLADGAGELHVEEGGGVAGDGLPPNRVYVWVYNREPGLWFTILRVSFVFHMKIIGSVGFKENNVKLKLLRVD